MVCTLFAFQSIKILIDVLMLSASYDMDLPHVTYIHRKLLTEYTSATMDQMNLVIFGMSAISLVGAVIQLAMVDSSNAEDIYRRYLGKVACCHFSLVSLI